MRDARRGEERCLLLSSQERDEWGSYGSTLGDEEAGREKVKGDWGGGSWGKNERKERRGRKEICGLVGRGLGEE
jgi:hypothetical protein